MQFGFLGINYQNAPLAVRDRTSFTDAMKLEFFQRAEEAGVDQCMVLSTCNRSEVYYLYEREEQQAQIQSIYEGMFPDVTLEELLLRLSGEEAMAVSHCRGPGISCAGGGSDSGSGKGCAGFFQNHGIQ